MNMLEFRLNNEPFSLDETTRVRLNRKNPACMIDSFPGDIALGIEIPVNAMNRALLGNPERFEKYTKSGDREYPGFEIRFDGYLLMNGTLVLNSATEKKYSGWLRSPIGTLGSYHREKYINELAWKENQEFVERPFYVYPRDEYVAPIIHNPAFWEGKGRMVEEERPYQDDDGIWRTRMEEVEYLTRQFRIQNTSYVNWRTLEGDLKINEGAVISPMLFLDYVVKELFRLSEWTINRNDWAENTSMSLLFLYNNFNIMKPTPTVVDKIKFYWDGNGNKVTDWAHTITEITWQIGTFNYRDLIPRVKFKDFVLGLQNYLNYIFLFRDDKKVDIIDRNAIFDETPIDVDQWFVDEWQIGDRITRRIKFVSEPDSNDGFQGDSYQDLTDRIDDFGEPVDTMEDLQAIENPEFGELRLVKSENKVYEWKWGVYTNEGVYKDEPEQEDVLLWEFVSSGPQPYLYGSGESLEEIKTIFSTLAMYSDVSLEVAIPGVLQHGNFGPMRSLWSDFTPRLLFTNPFGDGGAANIKNDNVNLNWDGDKGLIATRWNNWARLWQERLPVEANFQFPVNVIDYVRKNIYVPFRTEKGKFIIEEMETEFGLREVGVTTVKGYKV